MAKKQYTIYCDESSKFGNYFSNFYGGSLVNSSDREVIESLLLDKKRELNLYDELKWTKITRNYQEKYVEFIKFYFDFVRTGRLKIRIMFSHNYRPAVNLTKEQKDSEYFLLYYQFLKHAFGLAYSNPNLLDRVYVSLLLDQLPGSEKKLEDFKQHIKRIEHTETFAGKYVYFNHSQVSSVDSKKHTILQGLDIILGSMHFRLNDLHKSKPEGKRFRGKRTIAKEKVYKEINRQIRSIYPNFNIGVSTGTPNGIGDRWSHPYRHWCFQPANNAINQEAVKPR